MIIKQLSVFLENKTGRLTEMTKILSEQNINISAFSMAETADYGIIRCIVTKPEEAIKVLKENRFSVNMTDVVCLTVPHEPGGLYKALKILSENNVAVEYMYAFAFNNAATVVIRSESNEQTVKVLKANKMQLLNASDIYQI
ncbi:MAG TPA: amino acid-binding protein [Paludibacter sp.]|nr:amino acid-binding protein [Paludibacter sp.]